MTGVKISYISQPCKPRLGQPVCQRPDRGMRSEGFTIRRCLVFDLRRFFTDYQLVGGGLSIIFTFHPVCGRWHTNHIYLFWLMKTAASKNFEMYPLGNQLFVVVPHNAFQFQLGGGGHNQGEFLYHYIALFQSKTFLFA